MQTPPPPMKDDACEDYPNLEQIKAKNKAERQRAFGAICITAGTCLVFYSLGIQKGKAMTRAASVVIEITPALAKELTENDIVSEFSTKLGSFLVGAK